MSNKVLKFTIVMIFIVSLLFATQAKAVLYDGFDNGTLADGKWTIIPNFPSDSTFSEHGGMLYFSGTGALPVPGVQLRSTISLTGPFYIGMSFFDFSSTNNSPAGQGLSSAMKLGLGPNNNNVSISRGSNASGGFFEFARNVNGVKTSYVLSTQMTPGSIGLYYDGTTVYAGFINQPGAQPSDDWKGFDQYYTPGSFTPGWTGPVSFFIGGSPGGSGTTSFQIDNVFYQPVPLPPAVWLLGSGLIGLAGLRRRWKK